MVQIYKYFRSKPNTTPSIKEMGNRTVKPIPHLTFQLFIYENLNARYHYPIKRTRDVKKRVISLFH